MPYGKKLYKNNSRVYTSDLIYDETEEKLQSEINADVKADVDILKDHDGVITGEKTYSGSVATILDAEYEMPLKSCVVNIEPVQDLHGYDSPWPAGGGKNLMPGWETIKSTSAASYKIFVDFANNTYYTVSGLNNNQKSWVLAYDNNDVFIGRTAGGARTSVTVDKTTFDHGDGTQEYDSIAYLIIGYYEWIDITREDVESYPTQIEVGETATAFTPYSNICPISGWAGCNVTRTGKNLFNVTDYPFTMGTWIQGNTGNLSEDSTFKATADYIPVGFLAGKTITLNKRPGGQNPGFAFYDSNEVYISGVKNEKATAGTPMTVTVPSDAKYMRFTVQAEATNVQIELGSDYTGYEPFGATLTIPIIFPSEAGTIYGGTLDVTSGVLTVDRASVDMGNMTWKYYSGSGGYLRSDSITDRKLGIDPSALCSIYPQTFALSLSNAPNHCFGLDIENQRIYVKDSDYTGGDVFKTAMNGQKIVYLLDQPTSVTLTPTEVTTLLGQNNFWADTGDISISYGGLISVIDRSIDTLTDRLDKLKADQVKAKGLGEVEAEPGDIVTVTDAAEFPVKDLKVKIEPIQDLHGYENPWPVGGGKNKIPYPFSSPDGSYGGIAYTTNNGRISASGTTTSSTLFALALSLTLPAGNFTFSYDGTVSNVQIRIKANNANIAVLTSSTSTKTFTLAEETTVSIDIVRTSEVISINCGVQLESGSTASAWSPYSNICPISGWTSCKIYPRGANIATLDELAPVYSSSTAGIDVTESNGKLTFSGTANASGTKFFGSFPSYSNRVYPVKAGVKYTVSTKNTGNGDVGFQGNIAFDDGTQSSGWIEVIYTDQHSGRRYATFTPAKNGRLALLPKITVTNGTAYSATIEDVQLVAYSDSYEYPAEYYGESNGVSIPVSWQSLVGTVYGGTLDVTSGVLTVTHTDVDLGDKTWTQNSGKPVVYQASFTDFKQNTDSLWCEIFKPISAMGINTLADNSSYDNVICCRNERNEIIIKNTSVADAAELTTLVRGKKLVYELATPQIYQLTSTQVTLLQGYNNIWSDIGPIESLIYLGTEATNVQNEIDEFENKLGGIQKSISVIQDNMTAIRNYEPNEFVTVGKNLYIITANVSKGVSLIEGTNCRETTVMEQITNLLNIIASQNS